MKLKSLGIAAIGLATAGSALANQDSSIYFHANAGYAYHPWASLLDPLPGEGSSQHTWNNGNSGVAYGLDVGYQFNQALAVEAGYFALPTATLHTDADVISENAMDTTFKTDVYYLALRGTLPISQSFSATGKIGVGTQAISGDRAIFNQELGFTEKSETNVMLGAGLDYLMLNNIDINMQYLFFQGRTTAMYGRITQVLPNAQLLTLGVGYSFSV